MLGLAQTTADTFSSRVAGQQQMHAATGESVPASAGQLTVTTVLLCCAVLCCQVPDAVQGWNVAKLPLRRDVRHLDDQVVLEFYDKLDAFLLSMRRYDLDY
jgi:hypothetical protein